ncbi:MAG: o-succinylbenzoate synthase [Bacteroidota bacterium]
MQNYTQENITLNYLELYWLDLPQKKVFQSGIGTRKSKETLLIKWVDQEGRAGYGECSCRPDPYFSAEFLEAAALALQHFIAPQLKAAQSYEEVLRLMHKVRGWNFIKAALEAAMHQVAKQLPGFKPLEERLAMEKTEKVPVGISLGIYKDKNEFYEVVEEAIREGYQRLKFKISPAVDTRFFDHINALLFDQQVYVSFDANGSFGEADLDKLAYFANTYEGCIEQPTPPDRFDLLLHAKRLHPQLKVCFDEEVEHIGDLVKLHSLNIIDELNLKVGRVGGISSSVRILNYCHQHGIPCWMGGMFETGVGRLQNLEIAAFMNGARAHDLSPSSRYFEEDIISPEIEMTGGFIDVAKALKNQIVEEKIDRFSKKKMQIKINPC